MRDAKMNGNFFFLRFLELPGWQVPKAVPLHACRCFGQLVFSSPLCEREAHLKRG